MEALALFATPGPWIPRPNFTLPGELQLMLASGLRPKILVSGPPGCGKSRMLEQLQAELSDSAQVVLVDLGGTADLPVLESLVRSMGGKRQEGLREVIAEYASALPLLVVVDGFDKVESGVAKNLFGPNSPWFHPLLPAMVVLGPPTLLTWGREQWDSRFDRFEALVPFPVRRLDGAPDVRGLPAMLQILRQYWPAGSKHLRELALASGGLPRDAMRMLRDALLIGQGKLTPAGVQGAITRMEQELRQGLSPQQAADLAQIEKSHLFQGDPCLIERGLALRDGSGAWAVHPLLRG